MQRVRVDHWLSARRLFEHKTLLTTAKWSKLFGECRCWVEDGRVDNDTDGSIWVSSVKDERNVDVAPDGDAFCCDKLVDVLGRVHWMMASNCEDTSK